MSDVPHVRTKDFEFYKIPVPPLTEQVRIAAILDKFDTLSTSIAKGLLKEIELRQKQYYYYKRQSKQRLPMPDAIAREKQLKNRKRSWKNELIEEMNPY